MNQNHAIVNKLMEASPIHQAFVISALEYYAQTIQKADGLAYGLITKEAWEGCAEDVLEMIKETYGERKNVEQTADN